MRRFSKVIRLACALLATAASLGLSYQAAAQSGTVVGNTITLGFSGPFTGPLGELGKEYVSGANLYFDEINRNGGVHGRRIELLALDDGYKPDQTEINVKELIENRKVFALYGVLGTPQNMRAIPLANAARIPLFAPYTGADALRDPLSPYVFHIRASYAREIEAMIEHLISLGVTSIGVVHLPNAFGQAGVTAAESALTKHGRPPLTLVTPLATSGENAAQVAQLVAKANPAALIIAVAGDNTAKLIHALSANETKPMIFGLSVLGSRQLVDAVGAEAHGVVQSQVVPSPFKIDRPVVREYRKLAKDKGVTLSYTNLESYITAKIFTEALKRAGKDLTRERLMAALETLNDWDVGGLTVTYSPTDHVALDFVDLSIISHGRFSH